MKNASFNAHHIKLICEVKAEVVFRDGKEYNGKLVVDGVFISRVTVPKGRKFVPQGTYGSMAKQLKLTNKQFDSFLECSMTKEEYRKILKPDLGEGESTHPGQDASQDLASQD